jgi:nicotinamidase-related amidase
MQSGLTLESPTNLEKYTGREVAMKIINGIEVLESIEEIVNPKHSAFLVVDIQNDNAGVDGSMAKAGRDVTFIRSLLPNIQAALAAARQLNMMVVFLRNTRSKDGSHEAGPVQRARLKSAHSLGLEFYETEGTWGHEVLAELAPRPSERQIIKYRPSGFVGTPLDLILRNRGIKSVIVVGLVTESCVEGTVRDAYQLGYYPVILSDGVGSPRQELHKAAMAIMKAKYDVISSEQLLKLWLINKQAA